MKRIILFFSIILVCYAVYYDLTKGTLPIAVEVSSVEQPAIQQELNEKSTEEQPNYFEKEVESGETVLTIVEAYLQGPLPVSIHQLIRDFEELNEGTEASYILVGKKYKFPKYLPASD